VSAADLGRIPEPYRARVEREMNEARDRAFKETPGVMASDDAEGFADNVAAAAIAPYLKIAADADAAARAASVAVWGERHPTEAATVDIMSEAKKAASAARAEVWRARMADVDAGEEVSPDLAAAAKRAVESAQRAHLAGLHEAAKRLAGSSDPVLAAHGRASLAGDLPPRITAEYRAPDTRTAPIMALSFDTGRRAEALVWAATYNAATEEGCSPTLAHRMADAAKGEMLRDSAPTPLTTRPGVFEGDAWRVPGISGPVVLTIASEEGYRATVDALLRYLADKPGETVRTIAALVRLLPVGNRGRVFAHTRAFFEVIAALPGARLVHSPPTEQHPRHVYGAEAAVDGVEFEGLYTSEEAQP
jgi:hypothetical protein